MRTRQVILAATSALLLCLPGRGAAALKDASEIKKGILPDGISYYMVSNSSTKGLADFALVQRDFIDTKVSREALVSLPALGRRSPAAFLAAHGSGYGPEGFISCESGSTVFHFRNMDVSDKAVTDSTLLLMLGLASTCPGSQAIIISGDVEASLADRLALLSLTVSAREAGDTQDNYVWEPTPAPLCFFSGNTTEDVASVRISYSMQRLPKDKMSTLQPFVSRQYASYLGSILHKRLQADFRHHSIPLGGIRYHYHSSADGPGDEYCAVSVMTSTACYTQAVERIAAILADMDKNGVSLAELQDAKDKLVSESLRNAGTARPDNAGYVHRCTAAYLYGASLASDEAVAQMFASSRLSGEKELQLFNNYVAAMLDPAVNLTLGFDTPDAMQDEELPAAFAAGWNKATEGPQKGFVADYGDTLSLYVPQNKVKLRSETKENMIGGSIWTFSNGMRVIYKKTAAKGTFSYALLLRGGSTGVKDLGKGENAFVQDMLGISDVAGMSGEAFRSMLLANGITMKQEVSLADMRILGQAPSAKLPLLMQSLLSLANSRKVNPRSFECYKADEALRLQLALLEPDAIASKMDSLLVPYSHYSQNKSLGKLRDDLPARAEDYFREQFGKCADGVLVLIGDLEAAEVKKQLCATLGDFSTNKKYAVLPQVSMNAVTGTTTYTGSASDLHHSIAACGVNMAISAPLNFSMDSYLAYRLAVVALEKRLNAALAQVGAYATISNTLEFFPAGRITMNLCCRPCGELGLPANVQPAGPLALLDTVRSVFYSLSAEGVGKAELEQCRKKLENRMNSELTDDSWLMGAVLERYSNGKDVISGWQKQLKTVSGQSVNEIISSLNNGGRIEYVIL